MLVARPAKMSKEASHKAPLANSLAPAAQDLSGEAATGKDLRDATAVAPALADIATAFQTEPSQRHSDPASDLATYKRNLATYMSRQSGVGDKGKSSRISKNFASQHDALLYYKRSLSRHLAVKAQGILGRKEGNLPPINPATHRAYVGEVVSPHSKTTAAVLAVQPKGAAGSKATKRGAAASKRAPAAKRTKRTRRSPRLRKQKVAAATAAGSS